MSRIYGNSEVTYNFYDELLNTQIPKSIKDRRKSSWEEIRAIDDKIKIYLPKEAIDVLGISRTVILRQPLRRRTVSVIPADPNGTRAIVFPRKAPYKDNEYEYTYYLGKIIANDNPDEMTDFLVPGEYDELIPLFLEYLYVKEHGDTNAFSINYFNELKKNAKRFMRNYNYIRSSDDTLNYGIRNGLFVDPEYAMDAFDNELIQFEQLAGINMRVLSSFDAMLQLADKDLSNEEIKELIRNLMLNEKKARETVVRDMGIETFGYSRSRKELKKIKK